MPGSSSDDEGDELCEELLDLCWPSSKRGQCIACIVVAAVILIVIVCCLALVYATVTPVSATVESASVSRLLAADGLSANNTPSYGVSLVVAVRNPNFALTALHAGPLDADLRFGGGGGVVRLADAGNELKPKDMEEYRVKVAGELRDFIISKWHY